MTAKQQAAIFGTIVAIIVCSGIVWSLRKLADIWPLPAFLALCIAIGACMLLLAWRLDKRASDRQEREQSDPS